MREPTKSEYEKYLNEIGPPEHDHPENGGRIPYDMIDSYGTWLMYNDPTSFYVGYNEFVQEWYLRNK